MTGSYCLWTGQIMLKKSIYLHFGCWGYICRPLSRRQLWPEGIMSVHPCHSRGGDISGMPQGNFKADLARTQRLTRGLAGAHNHEAVIKVIYNFQFDWYQFISCTNSCMFKIKMSFLTVYVMLLQRGIKTLWIVTIGEEHKPAEPRCLKERNWIPFYLKRYIDHAQVGDVCRFFDKITDCSSFPVN